MTQRDARLVALRQLQLLALDPKTPAGPRVLALRTILEAQGVIGNKSTPMTGTEQRRAEEMTPAEMAEELESLRGPSNIN